ncbi:sarcosine oxidase subunit gamma [Roseisalinus antarcticus]|uniref:Sarcosine oxidase, gamma subunit family n=1 Tax=Roseisalinus antarcticus TaxID=254357 RepID=A0A1Y5RXH4_9RHOB|nr:sarcosine oxidase subunit gamma family protein [Roseisalinus antarcticus]SLN27804.1 Sarcosine oxidase, gamma subunit family [Roseisalinus antarcticus]
MVDLIALTPCAGLLPLTVGNLALAEVDAGPIHLIAPFRGGQAATDAALSKALGLEMPGPQATTRKGAARMLSVGPGQALLLGAAPPALDQAAVTDQSDGWAVVSVTGPDAREVLMRLVPVDLHPGAFAVGATARTMVGHMTASVTRTDEEAFEIIVFRSMARTLVHELSEAATGVAARG